MKFRAAVEFRTQAGLERRLNPSHEIEDKGNNFASLVTKGDHGLGIKNSDGQYNAELGAKNLQAISKWMFSWLK
jgi:hypothetical protein